MDNENLILLQNYLKMLYIVHGRTFASKLFHYAPIANPYYEKFNAIQLPQKYVGGYQWAVDIGYIVEVDDCDNHEIILTFTDKFIEEMLHGRPE